MKEQQSLFNKTHQSILPSKCKQPGGYIFETTPESKGDHIRREIEIIERDGELGVLFNMTGNFVKVDFFRKDCRLTLVKEI